MDFQLPFWGLQISQILPSHCITGQEMIKEKEILQGQRKVREAELYFESGKIEIIYLIRLI